MLVIVEGPDCSGKSYLIERMIKKFPGYLVKITDRPKDSSIQQRNKIIEHYHRVLDFAERNWNDIIILDRFYPSELVYSVKRGYDANDDRRFDVIKRRVEDLEHLFVFCDPGEAIILERMKQDPDDYVTEDENMLMLGRYRKFFDETQMNKVELDTTLSIEKMLEILHKEIK